MFGAELTAVASRSQERAASFAEAHDVANLFGSYESMISSGKIDIAYIATPNTFHLEHVIACLEQGVAMLCEKPISINRVLVRKCLRALYLNYRRLQ